MNDINKEWLCNHCYLVSVYIVSGAMICVAGCGRTRGKGSGAPSGEGRDLHWAALVGDEFLATRLLDEGADVNDLDEHGRATPLGWAAMSGNIRMVRLLLSRGADVNTGGPLYYAAQSGRMVVVQALLDAGADPNRFRVGDVPSALLAACREGHLDVVKLLIERGSELGAQDRECNPLIEAMLCGHPKVAELLIAKGINVNVSRSDGLRPLHIAASKGEDDLVKLLIIRGADPAAVNKSGLTAEQIARQRGHESVAEFLRLVGKSGGGNAGQMPK